MPACFSLSAASAAGLNRSARRGVGGGGGEPMSPLGGTSTSNDRKRCPLARASVRQRRAADVAARIGLFPSYVDVRDRQKIGPFRRRAHRRLWCTERLRRNRRVHAGSVLRARDVVESAVWLDQNPSIARRRIDFAPKTTKFDHEGAFSYWFVKGLNPPRMCVEMDAKQDSTAGASRVALSLATSDAIKTIG